MITDLFKTCNFNILMKNNTMIELMNVECDLPGFNIGTIEMPFQTMKDKRPGDSINFDNLTLTVNCDEDFKAYLEVYNQLILAHNPATNKYKVSEEIFDGYLILLSNKNNIQHKIHFYDMWIESVSPLQMQTISSDDNPLNFTVGLCYNFFVFE